MLYFSNYRKSYTSNLILSIPDLLLESGIYCVKGENGSGKTTLLKSIAGLISFEGNISFGPDINLKKDPMRYRSLVNYAEAEPIFPGFLTGNEMIDLFLTGKNASQEQADFLIASMNLDTFISQKIAEYSTGMLKKLSLALAFLGECKLILLDEPFITLDDKSLKVLLEWVRHYREKYESNFIFSSHQHVEIKQLPPLHYLSVDSNTLKLESA